MRGERASARVERDERLGFVEPRDVDDQRVEARPALGREDRGDGMLVGGVGAEPVNGLGRKGDEPPRTQQLRGLFDRVGGSREDRS